MTRKKRDPLVQNHKKSKWFEIPGLGERHGQVRQEGGREVDNRRNHLVRKEAEDRKRRPWRSSSQQSAVSRFFWK